MVVAVSVGYVWELPRLGWHVLGMCQDAGCGGLSPVAARRHLHIRHTLLRRGQERGRCGGGAPAQNCSGQWLVVSG